MIQPCQIKVTSDWLHKSTCLFLCVCVFTGVYPLFRRSAADLQGAAVRVHITGVFTEEDWDASARPMDPDSEGERLPEGAELIPEGAELIAEDTNLMSEEAEAEDPTPSTETPKDTEAKPDCKTTRATPDFTAVQRAAVTEDESFPVTVAVDQAMHLNLNGEFAKKKKIVVSSVCLSNQTNLGSVLQAAVWQSEARVCRAAASRTSPPTPPSRRPLLSQRAATALCGTISTSAGGVRRKATYIIDIIF